MSDDRIAQITGRCEKATAGPWKVGGLSNFMLQNGRYLRLVWQHNPTGLCVYGTAFATEHEDARFIAHAREDIPWLLVEVKRLREYQEGSAERLHFMVRHRAMIQDENEKMKEEVKSLKAEVKELEEEIETIDESWSYALMEEGDRD